MRRERVPPQIKKKERKKEKKKKKKKKELENCTAYSYTYNGRPKESRI